jgi:hypothetical protein
MHVVKLQAIGEFLSMVELLFHCPVMHRRFAGQPGLGIAAVQQVHSIPLGKTAMPLWKFLTRVKSFSRAGRDSGVKPERDAQYTGDKWS